MVGLLLLGISLAVPSPAAQSKPTATAEGKLGMNDAGMPILKTRDGVKEITTANSYLLHTLKDKRLQGRDVRLQGTAGPHGGLDVEQIFTVHDGKVFRVRYYCKVCNIEALEPGPCVCCQQPTEFQEELVEGTTP